MDVEWKEQAGIFLMMKDKNLQFLERGSSHTQHLPGVD